MTILRIIRRIAPWTVVAILVQSVAAAAPEREINLPIRLDPAYLKEIFATQVYTDPGTTARVWDDGIKCNFMVISDPQVSISKGLVNLTTAGEARVGQRVVDRCVVVFDWSGSIETAQEVELEPGGAALRFHAVDSRIDDETVRHGFRVGVLWDWVKDYVHPRLHAVRVDLQPALDDLKGVLRLILPVQEDAASDSLDTLALTSVEVLDDELLVSLNMQVPAEYYRPSAPAPALTPAELARFETAWQSWDGFITFIVKHFAGTAENRAVRRELLDVLVQARYDVLDILSADTQYVEPDPVRELFMKTWSRLAPVLRRLSPELPGERGLNLLSFITAADALQTLDALGPQFDLDISLDGLHRMARIVAPDLQGDPLEYNEQVDPELRELFDFGPPLRFEPETAPRSWFRGTILPEARAAVALEKDLVKKLNGWIPTHADLDNYLLMMHNLLSEAGREVASGSRLEPDLHDMFRLIVLATAWQETCWRQFKRDGDKVVPIRSGAGAVGLMQVVPTVWRGFYEPAGLTRDVGYNAVAGSEILLHYLLDYAIARGEHKQEGGRDNLAWATYAAYNGGPGQLRRYREPNTRPALRTIDSAFREKFQRLNGDEMSVRACYPG